MRSFLFFTLLAVLFLGCSNSHNFATFKLDDVDLSSDHKIISSQKIVVSGIQGFLKNELDKKELSSVLYRDTWIYAIQSTFRWPSNLDIKIKEHQPLASWKNIGYLTQSGLIISPLENDLQLALVNLNGPENKKFELLEFTRKIQSQLNRYGENLAEVKINSEGTIKATSVRSVSLVFNEKNFRDQLERLEDFISFELISGRLNHIKNMDLRYKNGISVLLN